MSNTLSVNQSQITLPEGFDASNLVNGSCFPIGSIYTSEKGNNYVIPNNAVYLGTDKTYNGTDAIYTITASSSQPVYVPANTDTNVQYANTQVYIGLSSTATQYTSKLVVNDTSSGQWIAFNLVPTVTLYNHTNNDVETNVVNDMPNTLGMEVMSGGNVKKSKVKAGKDIKFVGCINAVVMVAANTELYCIGSVATVAPIGRYTPDETTDVTHLSNSTGGTSDDINSAATDFIISNTNSTNMNAFVLASSSGSVLNKSNTPIQITDGGVTYVLDELCMAKYSAVATVLLYPGNQMTSNGVSVTVATIDSAFTPTASNNSAYTGDSKEDDSKEAAKDAKKMSDESKDDTSEVGEEVSENMGEDVIEDMGEEIISDAVIDIAIDLIFLIFI